MSSAAQDGDWFPQRIIWTSSWLKELNFSIGKTLLNPSTSQRHQKHKKTKHTTQFLRHDDRRPNQNPEAVGQWPPSPHIHTYTKLQRTAPHPNTHTKETDAQQHKREQKSFWSLQSTAGSSWPQLSSLTSPAGSQSSHGCVHAFKWTTVQFTLIVHYRSRPFTNEEMSVRAKSFHPLGVSEGIISLKCSNLSCLHCRT